jgi:hypothetical protein
MSFRVIDNFLSKKNYKTITKTFTKLKGNIPVRWAETDYRKHVFLIEAAKTYDFTKYKGFEEWSQNNTQCNPHVDKDEGYYQKTGKFRYPICSLIFYIEVKNLRGGELILAGDIIKPKSNRLVIFDPGLHHSVESFKGTRRVFLVNPWTHKPEAFKNEVV